MMPSTHRLITIILASAVCLAAIAARAQSLTTIYTFAGGNDGAYPLGVVYQGGILYGTTSEGGGQFCGGPGCGTVFAVNAGTGAENILYNFKGGVDGSLPNSGMIYENGTLYGTTSYGNGTVFAVNATSGAETVVHAFTNSPDGAQPYAGLIYNAGGLYGTTGTGGLMNCGSGCGTVFKVDVATGKEKILYRFTGAADGANPFAELVRANGNLYGTTFGGGYLGYGVVFKLDAATGAESVLHYFSGPPDATEPFAGLTYTNGTLYGLTPEGGNNNNCQDGCGAVFTVNADTGAESVIYDFDSTVVGYVYGAGMTYAAGAIYGITEAGGSHGAGSLFRIDPKTGLLTILYNFTGAADGTYPKLPLTYQNGYLYGVTDKGGANACNCGTVFKFGPIAQSEAVIHSFGSAGDGSLPIAGLIDLAGTFYGATSAGGANGFGAIFEISPIGAEAPIYSFHDNTDGEYPIATLTRVGGALYGTAEFGGALNDCPGEVGGCGTIFKVTTGGLFTALHGFLGAPDGAMPRAPLLNVSGTLYGTTVAGGTSENCPQSGNFPAGCGTIFKVTPAGVETVLYSFTGGNDGALPQAGLTNVGGALYGTTSAGGGSPNCPGGGGMPAGCGTVFKVTTEGVETVIHSFAAGNDGALPAAGLVNVSGTLYGTTPAGGASANCPGGGDVPPGCGTIFTVTAAGSESVVYAFLGGDDGAVPIDGLTNVAGVLYGTTFLGGAYSAGTVFSFSKSGREMIDYSFDPAAGDGANPSAGVVNLRGSLYGTTRNGGANGTGTVFQITR